MEKSVSCEIMVKVNGKYSTSAIWRDAETVYKELSNDMWAKYIAKATYIKRITDKSNYNVTREITVLYDNGVKRVYTVAL